MKIALGMSGGVDSAVSAALLKREGHEVLGVTLRFVDDESSREAVAGAADICASLGIEHLVLDCVDEFESCVIAPFVSSYAQGLTPSPCVGCNARCKIPGLVRAAKEHGCSRIATGHYARVEQLEGSSRFAIREALDDRKDQSYMLALLTQDQLACLVLPLGRLTKPEVRAIAADLGLAVAEQPDSQDICFVPDDYREFLRGRGIADEPGPIVDSKGRVLGRHEGLANFTIGQRKGIGVAAPRPYYVIDKRPDTRELVVGFADEAKVSAVRAGSMNWQAMEAPSSPFEATVKLRYRSPAVPCMIRPNGAEMVRIELRDPQPATAPGQYAVLYKEDMVLGGGVIEEVEQS